MNTTSLGANQGRLMVDCTGCRHRNNERYAGTREKLVMTAAYVGAATGACLEARNADNRFFRSAGGLSYNFCVMGITVGACVGVLGGLATSKLYELADGIYTRLFSRKCICLPTESTSREQKQPAAQGTSCYCASQTYHDDYWHEELSSDAFNSDMSDSDADRDQVVPDKSGIGFIENRVNFRRNFLRTL